MKLYATITSERGKPLSKSGNESIEIDLTVNREKIGEIYLDYHDDKKDGCKVDEWVLSWKINQEDVDPEIIAQGHM